VKLPVGATINEVKYTSTGDSGWSYSFLSEYRYSQGSYSVFFADTSPVGYPASSEEKTLPKQASDTTIRKGYRYMLCVEGQPSNDIWGYKIRYKKP